jgi:hypothetical protein
MPDTELEQVKAAAKDYLEAQENHLINPDVCALRRKTLARLLGVDPEPVAVPPAKAARRSSAKKKKVAKKK